MKEDDLAKIAEDMATALGLLIDNMAEQTQRLLMIQDRIEKLEKEKK